MAKRRWEMEDQRRERLAAQDPVFTGLEIVRRVVVIDREREVREAWRVIKTYDAFDAGRIWAASGGDMAHCVHFEADGNRPDWTGRYRHARFMPRWASRITLEVTGVRVERLQEISPADCDAEGIARLATHTMDGAGRLARVKAYRAIWEGINGPDSWEANPYVWVIEFRRVTAP
jgi:hypothetical protein